MTIFHEILRWGCGSWNWCAQANSSRKQVLVEKWEVRGNPEDIGTRQTGGNILTIRYSTKFQGSTVSPNATDAQRLWHPAQPRALRKSWVSDSSVTRHSGPHPEGCSPLLGM
jgi:hypothetical protein